ncbi:adenosylmethionine decarboxylase [Vampirovibrio chlorellavorus]|uniref:adenosylmethionine decarboxylase n=1 Tax=Vampirovibrio chlorellavorus TaxID=758823 RepID=UPI0026EC7142|nr:adenosylmethionine decarboxylase [Vampirovibrio chlorellavorus]
MTDILGRHLLVEFYGCQPETLDSVTAIETHMNAAALACGATIVQSTFHRFQPWGVSGVVVIAESHLAIHTWPEHGYASVDLYTCGAHIEPLVAYEHLRLMLDARQTEVQQILRGNLASIRSLALKHTPQNPDLDTAILKGGTFA